DGDTLLVLVHQEGAACHTGSRTCFVAGLDAEAAGGPAGPPAGTPAVLDVVERVIQARRAAPREGSYVSRLLAAGAPQMARKVGEEAAEVMVAALTETPERLVAEVADLWFHTLVLLGARDLSARHVFAELARRHRPAPRAGRGGAVALRDPEGQGASLDSRAGDPGRGARRVRQRPAGRWQLRRAAERISRGGPGRVDAARERGRLGAPPAAARCRPPRERDVRGQDPPAAPAGAGAAPAVRAPRGPRPGRGTRRARGPCRAGQPLPGDPRRRAGRRPGGHARGPPVRLRPRPRRPARDDGGGL